MSQHFQYRSALGAADSWTEVLGDVSRLGTLSITTLAEHLQVGTSTVILDDPDANLGHDGDTILGHHRFDLIETDMGEDDEHVFLGFIAQPKFRRGDSERPSLRTGAARQIEITLNDLNSIASFLSIPKTDTTANRPAETVSERMDWILGSDYMLNRIHDEGLVAANTTQMDATDYRGQRAANVISDCEIAAGFGWNAFVYYDEPALHYSLFFDNANTSTAFSSAIKISNVRADVDTGTPEAFLTGTTFFPAKDAELTRDYSEVGSGVQIPYAESEVYVTRDATSDIYGPRDLQAPNSNIKNQTTALRVANDFLFQHSTPAENITCSIEVPPDKVNAIKAGHRIEVKFQHLPGYEAWTWCRVIRRTVVQEALTKDRYVLDMDLSPQEAGPPPPEICDDLYPPTASDTYYALGGVNGPGSHPFNSDGVVYYWRGGLPAPLVPDTSYVGSWHFGVWGAGGVGTTDWAGDTAGNILILMTVGNGTWTIQTEIYGGSPRNLYVRSGPELSVTTHVAYIQSGDSVEVEISDTTDGDCIRVAIIGDMGDIHGGKWGFSEAEWVAA